MWIYFEYKAIKRRKEKAKEDNEKKFYNSSYIKGVVIESTIFETYHKASKYAGGGIMATWNPWHGCRKVSPGCLNCYVYRRDAEVGKDSSFIARTSSFDSAGKAESKRYI